MAMRSIRLFVLVALALLGPALHHEAAAFEPSNSTHRAVLEVASDFSRPCELPSLLEEERPEEERSADVELRPVGPAAATVVAESPSYAALPEDSALPGEPRIVSSVAPRGPPVRGA